MNATHSIMVEVNKARDKASNQYIKALSRYGSDDMRTVKAYQYHKGLFDACEIILEQIDLSMDDNYIREEI